MNLSEIKSRFASNCAHCDRDIKEGWDIFYDRDEKKVYCKPCGRTLISAGGGTNTNPDFLLTPEELALLPPETQEKMQKAGYVKAPSIEDRIDILTGSQSAVLDLLGSFDDTLGEIGKSVEAVRLAMIVNFKNLEEAIGSQKPSKPAKTE